MDKDKSIKDSEIETEVKCISIYDIHGNFRGYKNITGVAVDDFFVNVGVLC